jgi:hypothetical protein
MPELSDHWRARNAAAASLVLGEERMQRAVQQATVAELVELLETFSPARSSGPEWTRSFEPLIERLWAWRDDATMASLAEVFRLRGMPWMAVANALAREHGARIRAELKHPAWARLPSFATA